MLRLEDHSLARKTPQHPPTDKIQLATSAPATRNAATPREAASVPDAIQGWVHPTKWIHFWHWGWFIIGITMVYHIPTLDKSDKFRFTLVTMDWGGHPTQKKNDNWCEIGTPQLSDYGGCLINMVQAWSSPTKLTNHFLAIPLCWILVFRAQMPNSPWWNSRVACWSPTFFSMIKSEFGMVLTSPHIFPCMFTSVPIYVPMGFPICFPPLVPWKKRSVVTPATGRDEDHEAALLLSIEGLQDRPKDLLRKPWVNWGWLRLNLL